MLGRTDGGVEPDLHGPGGLHFTLLATHMIGGQPGAVVATDLNGDGKTDLVAIAGAGQDRVGVLLGSGRAAFGAPTLFPAGPAGSEPAALFATDLDRDGRQDVLVARRGDGAVAVLLGDGAGGLAAPRAYSLTARPAALAAADWDRDGLLDVAATTEGDRVDVLPGRGGGTLAMPPSPYGVGSRPLALATAEIGGGGRLDLVTANAQSGDISVLLNQPDGSFAPAVAYRVTPDLSALVAVDFNGDRRPEVAVTSRSAGQVIVLTHSGTGLYVPEKFSSRYDVGAGPVALAAADVTGTAASNLLTANGSPRPSACSATTCRRPLRPGAALRRRRAAHRPGGGGPQRGRPPGPGRDQPAAGRGERPAERVAVTPMAASLLRHPGDRALVALALLQGSPSPRSWPRRPPAPAPAPISRPSQSWRRSASRSCSGGAPTRSRTTTCTARSSAGRR